MLHCLRGDGRPWAMGFVKRQLCRILAAASMTSLWGSLVAYLRKRDLLRSLTRLVYYSTHGVSFHQTCMRNSGIPSKVSQGALCSWSITFLLYTNPLILLRSGHVLIVWCSRIDYNFLRYTIGALNNIVGLIIRIAWHKEKFGKQERMENIEAKNLPNGSTNNIT